MANNKHLKNFVTWYRHEILFSCNSLYQSAFTTEEKNKMPWHHPTNPTSWCRWCHQKALSSKNNLKLKLYLWSHLPLTDIESTFCSSPKMLLLSEYNTLPLCTNSIKHSRHWAVIKCHFAVTSVWCINKTSIIHLIETPLPIRRGLCYYFLRFFNILKIIKKL